MDVVLLEGDLVVLASHVNAPIVVAAAGSAGLGHAVDEVVGEGDRGVLAVSGDNVLASDVGSADVIDPDVGGTVKRNGVTTPDLLRVSFGLATMSFDERRTY